MPAPGHGYTHGNVWTALLAMTADEVRMKVYVNGEHRELSTGTTLAGLIEQLKLSGRLAAERNGEIVPRSAHALTALMDGDRVEIVRAIGGG
jgi:sulfur carrier protein